MSLPMLFGSVFKRQNSTSLMLILTLILSMLLINLSCFDLESQANNRQPWLLRSLSNLDANTDAGLRKQIASFSDGVGSNCRSVVLHSPEMLLLKQRQLSENMKKSRILSTYTGIPNEENFQRKQRDETNRQLAYLISPFSKQVLEIGQKLATGATINPNSILEDHYRLLTTKDLLKPILVEPLESSKFDDECRAIRANIKLEKDDIDKVTGRTVRTCRGLVQLNRCEGLCTSTAQPSIKSPSGFIKECNCCNEGSFKRVQVRLLECYSVAFDNQRITADNEDGQLKSYMDIEVEEPIDCQCRKCASLL